MSSANNEAALAWLARLPQLAGLHAKAPIPFTHTKTAAVVLLLMRKHVGYDTPHVILTRRSLKVRSHAGQVSFPGGRVEPTDADFFAAARRELHEEVGADPDPITLLGYLDVTTARDQTPVVCTVAYSTQFADELMPFVDEVASIHCVPWHKLQQAQARRFSFNIFGVWNESFFFDVEEDVGVWGLTARILHMADLREPTVKS